MTGKKKNSVLRFAVICTMIAVFAAAAWAATEYTWGRTNYEGKWADNCGWTGGGYPGNAPDTAAIFDTGDPLNLTFSTLGSSGFSNDITIKANTNTTLNFIPENADTGHWGFKAVNFTNNSVLTINTEGNKISNMKLPAQVAVNGGKLVLKGMGLHYESNTNWNLNNSGAELVVALDGAAYFWRPASHTTSVTFGAGNPKLVLSGDYTFAGANSGVMDLGSGGGTIDTHGRSTDIYINNASCVTGEGKLTKAGLGNLYVKKALSVKSLAAEGGLVSLDYTADDTLANVSVKKSNVVYEQSAGNLTALAVEATRSRDTMATVSLANGIAAGKTIQDVTVKGYWATAIINNSDDYTPGSVNKLDLTDGGMFAVRGAKGLNITTLNVSGDECTLFVGAGSSLKVTGGEPVWKGGNEFKVQRNTSYNKKLPAAPNWVKLCGRAVSNDTFMTIEEPMDPSKTYNINPCMGGVYGSLKSNDTIAAIKIVDGKKLGITIANLRINNVSPDKSPYWDVVVDDTTVKITKKAVVTKPEEPVTPEEQGGGSQAGGSDQSTGTDQSGSEDQPGDSGKPSAGATPDENGKLSNTIVEIKDVPTINAVTESSALTAIGVTAEEKDGKLILNGEPKDIGSFTVKVKLPDGSEKEVTIVINEVAKPVETLVAAAKAKDDWSVEYTGNKKSPQFVMTLPVTVELKDGFKVKADVTFEGASGTAEVIDTPGKGSSTKWVKVTGTVSDPAKATVKSVKFRVGAVSYTQAVDVKLSETKLTDKSTETAEPHKKSSGGGCDSGFGFIALAASGAIALLRKR